MTLSSKRLINTGQGIYMSLPSGNPELGSRNLIDSARDFLNKGRSLFFLKGVVTKPAVLQYAARLTSVVLATATLAYASLPGSDNVQAESLNFASPVPKPESIAKGVMPSQQLVTSYSIDDMNAIGSNRLIGIVDDDFSDNSKYVVELAEDEAGNRILQEKWKAPFIALTVDASQTDTRLKAAAGDLQRRAALGRLGLTRDDTNWSVYNLDGYTIIDIKFTPDNRYINTLAADSLNENLPVNFRFDIAAERFDRLTECVGCVLGGTQTPLVESPGGTYKNYSFLNLYRGYFENTYYPNGTITSTQLNVGEGFHGTRKLPQVVDSQDRNIIWVLNNDTNGIPPNNPLEGYGTAYPNINNVFTNIRIQPNGSLSYPPGSVRFDSLAFDLTADAVYGGMAVNEYYNQQGFGPRSAFVEYIAYSEPDNLSRRSLIWNDGDWIVQTGIDTITLPYLNTATRSSIKGLYASLINYETICDETQTCNQYFKEGSLMERDITNGPSQEKPWKKVPFKKRSAPVPPTPTPNPQSHKVYMPVIFGRN